MIDLLVKYAEHEGLEAEPGFAAKTVKWAVGLTQAGGFVGVLALGDTSDRKNMGQMFPRCPDLGQPELVACKGCHFLVESASVVALYGLDAMSDADAAKARSKHAFFVKLLSDAATAVPELRASAEALNGDATLDSIRADLTRSRAKPTDRITIMVERSCPVEGNRWHAWWREWRRGLAGGEVAAEEAGDRMVDFATGELVKPLATHPKIMGLADVEGLAMGSPLVGFDKPAFPSYGLEQSFNAAMGERSAAGYRAALNHLVSHSERLAGARVVHWYSGRGVPSEDDLLALAMDPSPSSAALAERQEEDAALRRARELLTAVRSGQRPDLAEADFYALTLSGAGGRVMVRDWMSGRFEQLAAAVEVWFDDLSIVNYSGSRLARLPRLAQLVSCVLHPQKSGQEYKNWIRPAGFARVPLWRAALTPPRADGTRLQIPFGVVARAIVEHSTFMEKAAIEDARRNNPAQVGLLVALLHTRMALFKAYWRRRGDDKMTCYLNEEHPCAAYHCGRLMAMYARLQRVAQGELNADVIQRFYAAASKTPALVLGRLATLSKFHLNKVDNPRLSGWFEQRIAEIACRIKDGMPPTLTLEEQSLFALGYYHQYAHRFKADPLGPPEDDITEARGEDNG